MIECKTIIDTYMSNGFDVNDDVDCAQICGLDILISNVHLSAPGLYVGNEIFYGTITNSLSQLEKMLTISLNLLEFRVILFFKSNWYMLIYLLDLSSKGKTHLSTEKYSTILKQVG